MTSFALADAGSVPGHGRAARSGASPLVQLVPFVLVLAIFYFVILLPMKRRQKKVRGVPGRPEGRRPGRHHRRHVRVDHQSSNDQSVQLQIAAERAGRGVARAPSVGYQGQDAGRRSDATRRASHAKNLRWKLLTIVGVLALAIWAFYAARTREGAARPRSEGRRAPGAAGADRRRAAARDRDHRRAAARGAAHGEHRRSAASPWRRRTSSASTACRRRRTASSARRWPTST